MNFFHPIIIFRKTKGLKKPTIALEDRFEKWNRVARENYIK